MPIEEEQESKTRKIDPEPTPQDMEKEEQEIKRRRLDEMRIEDKAIKYLPPLIGRIDKHVIQDYTNMMER